MSNIGSAIGDILSPAIGVAISPVPIIAVILILFSKRARSNGLAFLLGWFLALCVVCTVVMLIGGAADVSSSSGPSRTTAIIRIVLGALFFLLAWRNWKKRPAPGEEPHLPKWMEGIDGFNALRSFLMAAALSGLNPKNLVLTLAAAMSVSQAGLSTASSLVPLAVFVVIASLTVAVPVLVYTFAGAKAEHTLTTWKAWLTANNATVMMVLFLVFGMVLIGKGVTGL
jgi:threonine/homoserine/homoserine lactone efflux protein